MLDYTQEATGVRTMIDGVWIPWEPRTRETGDPALESLKLLCGLNPQDRQSRQEGTFLAEFESKKFPAVFVSQGTATGERILIQFEEKKIHFKDLDELGMRTKLQEQLRGLLDVPQGLLLVLGHARKRFAEHDGRGVALLRPFYPRVRRAGGGDQSLLRRGKRSRDDL